MNTCLLMMGLAVGCISPSTDHQATAAVEPEPSGLIAAPDDRWLAEDKARHFSLSFAATAFAYGASRFAARPAEARLAAGAVGLALGVGKEVVDVRRGTYFSLKDLVWDAAGVGLGLVLANQIR